MTIERAARERVLADHRDTVAAVLASAGRAVDGLAEPADRDAVVDALGRELDDDLRAALVALLVDAVDATGRELQAEPVAAPPYLVVAARGPIVRATLSDARLVVLVRAFELVDGGYVRAGGSSGSDAEWSPEAAVEVRVRRRP